jgi:SAM-dependent methyltransferase
LDRIKRRIPQPLAPAAREFYYRLYRRYVRLWCWWAGRGDTRGAREAGFPALPAPALRFRVSETPSLPEFLTVGRRCAENLESALEQVGRPVEGFRSVLDFGCGCGRTLLWLARRYPRCHWSGADTDPDAIAWCRRHIPGAQFEQGRTLPPLAFPRGSFDLIYAISVFTHLSEEYQLSWLDEFHRLLAPGGLLLVTLHGEAAWRGLPSADIDAIRREGILFRESGKLAGIFPRWYQTTYHHPEYVRKRFAERVKVVAYLPGGMGYQDVLVAAPRD